ncbi:Golgi reassembly-stacking protein 2-like [Thalassophryne amazonica]|uniref:Golgi reassembly-stacking protein 2-like n=1 Tax=Thalassophryne amazonica TaxID=390379 RepID=UPI0014710E10|nr:Golgi reassembly-stacking protein 2-like [Thalassophryne amazonica]
MGGAQSIQIPGGGTEGYHVLRVQENSPGSDAGLEPFFDFIVSISGTRLNKDNDTLKEVLKINADRPTKMQLYNSKTLSVRQTTVTPSSTWGGSGLLGISIRFCSFEGANENVWHVLEVEPNSPAALAGLRSHTDYIIGADTVMSENEDLFSIISTYEGKELKLFVYSTETDCCREVFVTPNCEWGGQGSLGCGIGYGYLHRIPMLPFINPGQTLAGVPSPKDGITEVQLAAVLATEPVAPSSAPDGLEQRLAGLSVNSNPTSVVTSFHTGLPPLPNLPNSNAGMTDVGQGLPYGYGGFQHSGVLSLGLTGAPPAVGPHPPELVPPHTNMNSAQNTSQSSVIQMDSSVSLTPVPAAVTTSESVTIAVSVDLS